MSPAYDLKKIRYATDRPTFERAVKLYEQGKVRDLREEFDGYTATVMGTEPYAVEISAKHFDQGFCGCYVGRQNTLCKHMVAVAIAAVSGGQPIKEDDAAPVGQVVVSDKRGEISDVEIAVLKKRITEALQCIKPYNGPSRIWFAYQTSLSEGCARLTEIVSGLPVGVASAKMLVGLLIRLDKKVCGGVDDSDGTVGGFMSDVAAMLVEYTKSAPACIKAFAALCGRKSCFDWDGELIRLYYESRY